MDKIILYQDNISLLRYLKEIRIQLKDGKCAILISPEKKDKSIIGDIKFDIKIRSIGDCEVSENENILDMFIDVFAISFKENMENIIKEAIKTIETDVNSCRNGAIEEAKQLLSELEGKRR